jgi:Ca2+-binding RTX toxin-like protein/cytoskeletal protein CcmA (bactofilin family)
VTAQLTDAAGNSSTNSANFSVTVDTVAPTAPTITSVDGTTGLTSTTDTSPTLGGTAAPNSTVQVFQNGVSIGTTQADASGNWSLKDTNTLSTGTTYTFTATATDAAGNTSSTSTSYSLTINSSTVTIATGSTTNLSGGTLTATNIEVDGTLKGPGTVNADTINLSSTGSVVAASNSGTLILNGNITGTGTLQISNHSTLEINGSVASTITVSFANGQGTVGTLILDQPSQFQGLISGLTTNDVIDFKGVVITSFDPGVYNAGTNITTVNFKDAQGHIVETLHLVGDYSGSAWQFSSDGAGGTNVVDPPTTGTLVAPSITAVTDNVGLVQGTVSTAGFTDDTTPTLNGTAAANSTVSIYDGTKLLGVVIAASNGSWTFTSSALGEGSHSFTATVTDATGNVTASTAYTLMIDTTAPGAPAIQAAMDNVGAVQGPVANAGFTNDTTPTLNGMAEANSTVSIYDGTKLLGVVIAASNGSWTFTPSAALAQGSHSFTATATDAAGNLSVASSAYTLTIDTTAPGAPLIKAVSDNVGQTQGTVSNVGSTDDNTPTLTGTAEANSIVTIYDGNTLLGTATADGNGNWTFTTAALSDGDHIFTAAATDAAGNLSVVSSAYDVTINSHDYDTVGDIIAAGFLTQSQVDAAGGKGTNGADVLIGSNGGDTINAGNGDDIALGQDGNDTINGSNGNDILFGQAGNDVINAGGGDDTVYGGSGNDQITGGPGVDQLWGGSGHDTFVFTTLTDSLAGSFAGTPDVINDFISGSDKFQIGHTLALAPSTTDIAHLTEGGSGNLANDIASVLNTGNLVANGAAQVTITGGADAGTYVIINDGTAGFNAAADAVIKLANGAVVHATDFIV